MKLILIIISIFLLTSCYGWNYKDDPSSKNNSYVNDYWETDDEFYEEVPEQTQGDFNEEPDDCGPYLPSWWMVPENDWLSWAYLKMIGPIADYDGEYEPAVYIDGKMELKSGTTDFTSGSYRNYQSQILIAQATTYEFTDVDQVAYTAVLDYWEAVWQFSQQLVPVLKEEGLEEAGFGGKVFFHHTYYDIEFDSSGSTTYHLVRKNCYLAVSAIEELEEDGEIYDIPVGDMYGCFVYNVDGSVGETLYMMFKNQMTENEATLLEYFNTQTDGSVLEYGDEGFMSLCQCYDENGKEVNCWEYDGPGGAEECPSYVPENECGTDDENVDQDGIDDSDESVDVDVYNSCEPNPCLEIIGSDGVCTPDGDDFFCGCTENYNWNSENNVCDPKMRSTDCNNTIPENSSYSGSGKFFQTWDGDSWEPAVSDCEWECAEGYWESEGECVKPDDDSINDEDTE